MGLQVQVVNASTSEEIDAAFATFARERPDILFVGGDSFFLSRRVQLTNWAVRLAMPAAFSARDFTEVGGLMAYASDIANAYRQVGFYTGRILKGEKPSELPVMRSTTFELMLNLKTAKTLDLAISPTLLALADEVIE